MAKVPKIYLEWVVEPEVRQFCGPIFFTRSTATAYGVNNNGTFGLVDTGKRKLLITCYHVWDGFQKARLESPELKMCIILGQGNPIVFAPDRPIGEDQKIDIATFDMEPFLTVCGERKFYPLHRNPPRKINRGDVAYLIGFPGHFRRVAEFGAGVVFGRQSFGVVVDDSNCSGSQFISDISNLKIKQSEITGISGCPCFLVREYWPIQLVGFTTKSAMNLLTFTHARCVNPDGTINKQPDFAKPYL